VPTHKAGSFIGAIGGFVFVQANAAAFPHGVALALRVAAVLAFVVVLRALQRSPRTAPVGTGPPRSLGTGYAAVVVAEVLGIVVGLRLLSGPLDTPAAAPAWIAFVVGAHLVALAMLLRQPALTRLGCAIAGCGVVGLVVAVLGTADAVVAAVAGVVPGALLLAAAVRAPDLTPTAAVA
jgi:hypothetical protein